MLAGANESRSEFTALQVSPLKLLQQSGSLPIFDILRLAGDGLAPPDPEHQSSCETKTPPRYLADEAYFQ